MVVVHHLSNFSILQNTITHRNGASKYKTETSWTPPRGFAGAVIFRCTVVQSKSVFWTALDSQSIQITAFVEPKPNLSYNRQQTPGPVDKQPFDNIQSSSIPQTQSSIEGNTRIKYEVCEKKFCFGLPVHCVQHRTCNMLVSGGYVPRGDGMVEFEIYADVNKYNGNSYYSMGLSTDDKMGKFSDKI